MTKERVNIASGSPWEPLRGYSRAVRVSDMLFVSGTTAMSAAGEVVGIGDAYEQTRHVIKVIKDILAVENFTLNDVIRTRLFVTNISKWEENARAHSVTRLVDPRLLVEMEVDAQTGCTTVKNIRLPDF